MLHSTGAGVIAQNSFAGGVALSSTRVIYDGSRKEASLTVNNKSTTDEFLIQSWIDDANGNKKTPFIITPPLFKLSPTKNNVLRIVNTTNTLPQDRESVYWINVKAIPAKSEDAEAKNVLQIAVRTRLKLFYRPAGLKGNSMDGWNKLQFTSAGANQIKVENPSAFNLTFNKFYANGRDIEKTGMVPAKGSLNIELPAGTGKVSEVKYNIINDFGTAGDMLTQRVN
ncbi:long polar fimbrial chaperone LpfB [Salmonella enterica subsp. enterica serovar Infantis]|nr:long polar fimbrial chaperone LpfB [Salmonella enterica subsp. enterica serovar Infantis]